MPRPSPNLKPINPEPTLEELCQDGMLTIEEAVEFTKISEGRLWEYIAQDAFPTMKPARCRLIPKRALVIWLAKQLELELERRSATTTI
jgi:hypothetical protein